MRKKHIWKTALTCILLMTLLCGILYPLTMTGIAQLIFPKQANGSQLRIEKDGKEQVIGSAILAQEFTQKKYLIGRPDTGAPSNRASLSEEQKEIVEKRVAWWHTFDPETVGKKIPDVLVTGSGSGVDPDITVEAANFQVARIAEERNISEKQVTAIIQKYTTEKTFGVLGEQSVNVLKVNLALDGYEIK